jgi:hypothetical protein
MNGRAVVQLDHRSAVTVCVVLAPDERLVKPQGLTRDSSD